MSVKPTTFKAIACAVLAAGWLAAPGYAQPGIFSTGAEIR